MSVGITALAATSVNYASASSSVPQSAPSAQDADASVPLGGDGRTRFDHRNDDNGQVHVNERSYSVEPGVCTAVISSPATSFNVRNESDRTVEFFTGITCDNGAAIATIGPRNASSAIPGTTVFDGAAAPFALVGSFRAIDKHH
ncbi:predicted protein [Streptomyces azureus]|uniref:Uncharacterized protein n=1 Tax=Streptomyces azureus TaxID=146537 RepID=A0A0K8PLL0_STRAJ|nr:predicted protein [Streptomyces azureus]